MAAEQAGLAHKSDDDEAVQDASASQSPSGSPPGSTPPPPSDDTSDDKETDVGDTHMTTDPVQVWQDATLDESEPKVDDAPALADPIVEQQALAVADEGKVLTDVDNRESADPAKEDAVAVAANCERRTTLDAGCSFL